MPAYDQLVRDYHALVFHVARGIVRDTATAEDVAQDVFLDFLRHPGALERASNLKAFVARSAANRAFKVGRAATRRAGRESAVSQREAVMGPVEELFRRELRANVEALPEEERLAVDLHYMRGLTLAETSEAMEIPAGTVSTRLRGAIARLRQALGAAAFAGLLAALESELGGCAAAEAVPASLEARLLGLRGAAAGGTTWARRVALGVGMAALLAILTATWILRDDLRGRGGPADLASSPAASEPTSREDARLAAAAPPRAGNAAGAETTEETILDPGDRLLEGWELGVAEGFLYRSSLGLTVVSGGLLKYLPVEREADMTLDGRYFSSEEAFAGLPVGTIPALYEFVHGGAGVESVPRTRVRVRVREHLVPDEPAEPDITLEDLQTGRATAEEFLATVKKKRKPRPRPMDVVEVLEVEILSPTWLQAWKDLILATGNLDALLIADSGVEKRAQMYARAAAVADAIQRVRLARAGVRGARWQARMEEACAEICRMTSPDLRRDNELAGGATRDGLFDLVLASNSPEALRDAAVRAWGEEALWLEFPAVDGDAGDAKVRRFELDALCALGPDGFAEVKRRLAAGARPKGIPGSEAWAGKAAVALGYGISLVDLGAFDKERLAILSGATVAVIEPGSAAEQAGLRAGDVVERVWIPDWKPKPGGANPPSNYQVYRADHLGFLMEKIQAEGWGSIEFQVARPEGAARVRIVF
ncbi:MAG: sigma-70 family RNA polymerase sigma factor [Planctomycetes bacterium]|nr:sigma-70 family RNA polymerase sigma factor [Planctomycetota bacterium]